MKKTIFLDIETTGFSGQWDYVIELAAVCYDLDDGKILSTFHKYVKPGRKIPQKITELTGITNEAVAHCPSEKEVLMDFNEWFVVNKPTSIVGHNCKSFDIRFLNERFSHYYLSWDVADIEIIDTLALARQLSKANKISPPNLRQPTLAAYFGIEYDAHSAINDVVALIDIYKKLKTVDKPVSRLDLGF